MKNREGYLTSKIYRRRNRIAELQSQLEELQTSYRKLSHRLDTAYAKGIGAVNRFVEVYGWEYATVKESVKEIKEQIHDANMAQGTQKQVLRKRYQTARSKSQTPARLDYLAQHQAARKAAWDALSTTEQQALKQQRKVQRDRERTRKQADRQGFSVVAA